MQNVQNGGKAFQQGRENGQRMENFNEITDFINSQLNLTQVNSTE